MSRTSKLMQHINWRVRVTISDTRTLLGTFMAFDKHMNIVLADTEEYRKVRGKKASEEKEEKRTLGFVLLRGENIISITPETPPPPKPRAKQAAAAKAAAAAGGPGVGRAAGRGMPVAPLGAAPKGLTAPVRGVGAPLASAMMPQGRGAPMMSAPPVAFQRPPGAPGVPPPMFGGANPPGAPGGGPPMMPGFPGPFPGMPFPMGRGGPGPFPGMPQPPMGMMPPGMPPGMPMFGRGMPPAPGRPPM